MFLTKAIHIFIIAHRALIHNGQLVANMQACKNHFGYFCPTLKRCIPEYSNCFFVPIAQIKKLDKPDFSDGEIKILEQLLLIGSEDSRIQWTIELIKKTRKNMQVHPNSPVAQDITNNGGLVYQVGSKEM